MSSERDILNMKIDKLLSITKELQGEKLAQ